MPTDTPSPKPKAPTPAGNAATYANARAQANKTIADYIQNIEKSNREIRTGKAGPEHDPRRQGYRFIDLANACISAGLNLDFTQMAKMYDGLIPSLDLIQAKSKTMGGKDKRTYEPAARFNQGAHSNLMLQATKLVEELASTRGFVVVKDKVISSQDVKPENQKAIAQTIFAQLRSDHDTNLRIAQETNRISVCHTYLTKLAAAGGINSVGKHEKLFDPKRFEEVNSIFQRTDEYLPVQLTISRSEKEAQQSATHRSTSLANLRDLKNKQSLIIRTTTGKLLAEVIERRQHFLATLKTTIPPYFNTVWPQSYDEYVNTNKTHNNYTSDMAVPHTLKSLRRVSETADLHQPTGLKIYGNVLNAIANGRAKLGAQRSATTTPGPEDEEFKLKAQSQKGRLLTQIGETISDINDELSSFSNLSFAPELPKSTSVSIDDIVEELQKQLTIFSQRVGTEVIPRLYSAHPIKAADNKELLQALNQEPYTQPIPGKNAKTQERITYKFSFGADGQVDTSKADSFLSYVKDTKKQSSSQLLNLQTVRPTWPAAIFEKVDEDDTLPTPDDLVVLKFHTFDDHFNEQKPVAIGLKREELYARHTDLLNSSFLQCEVIPNPTEEDMALVEASEETLIGQIQTFGALLRLKKNPQQLIHALSSTLKLGKDFNSLAYPIKLKLPEGVKEILDPTSIVNSVVQEYFKLLNASTSGSKLGFFPYVEFDVEEDTAHPGPHTWIPVFFNTDDNTASAWEHVDYDIQQAYDSVKEASPWPEYALVGDSFDPEATLKVKYTQNGEEKVDDISVQDIYARGLDSEQVRTKEKITDWTFDSNQPPEGSEAGAKAAQFVFFTDENLQLNDLETSPCEYCKVNHYNYAKEVEWNPTLQLFGRDPSEKVIVKWRAAGAEAGPAKTAVVRRHELFERNPEIRERAITYYTLPVRDPHKGLGFYGIDKNQSLVKIYGSSIPGAPPIDDPQELNEFIEKITLENMDKGSDLFRSFNKLPANTEESVDITDTNVANKLSRLMTYYDPTVGYVRNIEEKDQLAGQALIDTFINQKSDAIKTMRAQTNLPGNPTSVWYSNPSTEDRGRQLSIDKSTNKIYVQFPDASAALMALINDKSIAFPSGKDPSSRKFEIYQDPKHKQWVVDIPWVQSMAGSKTGINSETGESELVFKTPIVPRDSANGEDEIIDTFAMPMPLSSPADIRLELLKVGDEKIKGWIKLIPGQADKKGATGHYELVGDHYRQIKWLSGYNDPKYGPIQLTTYDTMKVIFDKKYQPTSKKLSFETMPVQRALELAASLWYNHRYAGAHKEGKVSSEWRFSKNDLVTQPMDENGLVTVKIKMKAGRPREVSLMTALRMHAKESTQAATFLGKLGKPLCSNWVRNQNTSESEMCSGVAEHKSYPQELYMTKKTTLGEGSPKWIWGTKELENSLKNAKVAASMPGQEKTVEFFQNRYEELKKNIFGNSPSRNRGEEALEVHGGLCTPCWMHWYDVIPESILLEMWKDLEEIRALSAKFLGKKSISKGHSYFNKGTAGTLSPWWLIKLVDGTILDKVQYVKAPNPDERDAEKRLYTVRDENNKETNFKERDIMFRHKAGYDSGSEIVYGDLYTVTYQANDNIKTFIGSDEGTTDAGQLMFSDLQGKLETIDPKKIIGEIEEFSEDKGKDVILDKLGDFYGNYLSDRSFWEEIKNYLGKEMKGEEPKAKPSKNPGHNPGNRRNKITNQLTEWHKSLQIAFMELINSGDTSTPLIDLGMDDGTSVLPSPQGHVEGPRDHAEKRQMAKRASHMPWFTLGVIRVMLMVSSLKMWNSILKTRYARRELSSGSDSIVSMMSLTRPDVRNRMQLSAALRDNMDLRPRFGASQFKWLGVKNESANMDQYGKVIVDSILDAPYLNGLTGIIESIVGNQYVIRLDRNDVILEESILVSKHEISPLNKSPILAKTPGKPTRPIERQKQLDEVKNKADIIKIIGDLTSEHISWS